MQDLHHQSWRHGFAALLCSAVVRACQRKGDAAASRPSAYGADPEPIRYDSEATRKMPWPFQQAQR
jgi:hypothetical protein